MTTHTHDYTKRKWGHDYTIQRVIDGGKELTLAGWGEGIKTGDFLILQNGDGSTRYAITDIDYFCEPPDMWYARAKFAPRTES